MHVRRFVSNGTLGRFLSRSNQLIGVRLTHFPPLFHVSLEGFETLFLVELVGIDFVQRQTCFSLISSSAKPASSKFRLILVFQLEQTVG
jgi:hypothetical protein